VDGCAESGQVLVDLVQGCADRGGRLDLCLESFEVDLATVHRGSGFGRGARERHRCRFVT
jgi:hypothetical protein